MDADSKAYFGHLGGAEELTRRAVASAQHADEKEVAATYEAQAGVRQGLFGNPAAAKQHAATALSMTDGRDTQFLAAMAYALAGDSAKVQTLANDFSKRFPEDTLVRFNYLPSLRGEQALLRHDSTKALAELQVALPYEGGQASSGNTIVIAYYPVFVRAEAFRMAKRGREAAAEYQKILDHSGVIINLPLGALAHLGLARAYALDGDSAKSKIEYQNFLALWKDADPDIPLLKEAKAEYASLH
jgi:hypothetical protein